MCTQKAFIIQVRDSRMPRKLKKKLKKEGRYRRSTIIFKNCSIYSITWVNTLN